MQGKIFDTVIKLPPLPRVPSLEHLRLYWAYKACGYTVIFESKVDDGIVYFENADDIEGFTDDWEVTGLADECGYTMEGVEICD